MVTALDNVMSTKISIAGSEGSGESAYLHKLAWAFVTVPKHPVLAQMAICVPFMWAAKVVASLHQQPRHICATIDVLYQSVKNAPSASKMLPVRCNKISFKFDFFTLVASHVNKSHFAS